MSFPDDPLILQGSWQGIVQDYPAEGLETELQLELTAMYESTSSYDISRTFKLGDEAVLPLEGYVRAGYFEIYRQIPGISGAREDGEGVIEPAFLMIPRPLPTERFATAGGEDERRWTVHANWSKKESPGMGQLSGQLFGSYPGSSTFNVERSSGN